VALGASGGGSANYINQPHTNVSFVNTATNVLSGNAPADGSFNTWHHYRTHTNQPYFDYSIGYSKFPNVGSALSNDVAFTGWGWGGSTTNMMGGIWHERWYRPNSGNPAQQEWYLRFDGTNGFFQDRRPFMFEWKEDGNWAGPFIRGTPTFQNIGATTNLLELRDNFAHTMVADTFAINGVNAGRAEVRMRQRGTVAFYNTANSLSWALTIHPNENGLAIFGNDAGATNVIVTNFNSAPMILGIPRGGLEIGPSSATVSNILVATATLDFGSTLSCTNSDLPITVTGTTTNDFAQLCIPFQVGNTPGASFNHFLSNDTVWVRFVNNRTNAAVDPVAGVFRALVTKVR
jgi:hypothetical protein